MAKIDICNKSLSKCGNKTITSIDDPETTEEEICALWYDLTLREAFSEATPSCSIKRALLPLSATPPAFGYVNAFKLPNDCIRFLSVGGASDNIEIESVIENGYLLTDQGSSDGLEVRYIFKNENTSEYESQFENFLVGLLASKISFDLGNDLQQTAVLQQEAEKLLKKSRIRTRQESKPVVVRNSKYQSSRIGGLLPKAERK